MTVDSRLGDGAAFTVTFPQAESREPAGQEENSYVLPAA
jgi:hypothetical protein